MGGGAAGRVLDGRRGGARVAVGGADQVAPPLEALRLPALNDVVDLGLANAEVEALLHDREQSIERHEALGVGREAKVGGAVPQHERQELGEAHRIMCQAQIAGFGASNVIVQSRGASWHARGRAHSVVAIGSIQVS